MVQLVNGAAPINYGEVSITLCHQLGLTVV